MAKSPTHRFGQIIGEVVEAALREPLDKVAKKNHFYLDFRHPRPARGGKSKVGWVDSRGNRHDLDYVLEAGGTEEVVGKPKAFIEIAYRRYTKHSRNKAQEIQGAVGPLFEMYRDAHPFIGVVLAGVFTENSLKQMRSHGFGVLYLPFESVRRAFAVVAIDADFDEHSDDNDVQLQVAAWAALHPDRRRRVASRLRALHREEFARFMNAMELSFSRHVRTIAVLAIHAQACAFTDVASAIEYIRDHDSRATVLPFVRYEVNIRYSNDDEVRGAFESKQDAIRFLESFL